MEKFTRNNEQKTIRSWNFITSTNKTLLTAICLKLIAVHTSMCFITEHDTSLLDGVRLCELTMQGNKSGEF